ncbi:helix-turn-helix transcriptional regulator [Cellulomonas carbonis]|uniref:Transcriptional regulator n=1 Tax=Cellulomonas carbonis T26 TaxID=947969 RepID=A0A0A0BSA2_9CELL|nr:helix-turn-helix domain-containing protein [Cellulomonas carbonis]KGM10780.1 transcriptional regulator [Cellulomonas carbonis T26]GGB92648.1 ArsR family transcriptional regulator [Cellulomonas carbonis]
MSRSATLGALASASRVAILHLLQQADGPVPVDDVAAGVGLHVNTTREHLERLRDAGFVERDVERLGTRGRPRILYRSVERPAGATLDERFRGELLRALVAAYGEPGSSSSSSPSSSPPSRPSVDRTWPDHVGHDPSRPDRARTGTPSDLPTGTARPVAGATVPTACREQVAALEAHLEDLGLDPVVEPRPLRVHLHRCPFQELARRRTQEVCSVHLTLVRGVLAAHGGPVDATRLEPFVGPDHCVLHLAVRGGAHADDRADDHADDRAVTDGDPGPVPDRTPSPTTPRRAGPAGDAGAIVR